MTDCAPKISLTSVGRLLEDQWRFVLFNTDQVSQKALPSLELRTTSSFESLSSTCVFPG